MQETDESFSSKPVVTVTPAMADAPRRSWSVAMSVLALLAMGLSSLLFYKSMTGSSLPGCAPGSTFDCDSVLGSSWSHVLGVPVSLPALVGYAVVLACVWLVRDDSWALRRWAWRLGLVMAAVMAGAAVWFIAIQIHLHRFCVYCMIAHGLGALMAVMLTARAPLGRSPAWDQDESLQDDAPGRPVVNIPVGQGVLWLMLGLLLVAAMATSQLLAPGPTHLVVADSLPRADFDTGPGPQRKMTILGGKIRISPHEHPMMGSPDAEKIIVYLFDYTCPNCRAMNKSFRKAVTAYDGRLGIIKLAVPLDAQCNPYVEETAEAHQFACELAKLSLAVWKADASKFSAYDDWLNEGENPPWPEEARRKAVELVGQAALDDALAGDDIQKRIESHFVVYGLTGGTVVPQFVMGNTRVFSRPDEMQLFELFEKELGLPVPAGAAGHAASDEPAQAQP